MTSAAPRPAPRWLRCSPPAAWQPVSYAEWLRISAAEEELAASLGRGDRVKLPHRDAVWSAARPRPR